MDKIKIFMTLLALISSFENCIATEIQDDILRINKDIDSHITIEENDLYILSVHISDLDFTNSYVWEKAIEKFEDAINITFDNCIFSRDCIDFFPGCFNATKITFVNCRGVSYTDEHDIKCAAIYAMVRFEKK